MPANRVHTVPTGAHVGGRSPADGGFSLVEVLVSLGIISVVMGATIPFLVGSLKMVNQQRTRQAAIQVANDGIERARALKAASLVVGRGKKATKQQWDDAPDAAASALAITDMKWDTDSSLAVDAGKQAPLPTATQTVTIDGIGYYRNWYVGQCWQPTIKRDDLTAKDPALDAQCVVPKKADPTDVPFYRVVVAVTWEQSSCPTAGCVYVTSTLMSTTTDPVFALKRPPPKITDPGTVYVYRTEAVSRPLTAVGGVLPLTWTSTAMPAGLSLTTAGVLTGTPTTNGSKAVTVSVADQDSFTDSQGVTITVIDPLTVPTPATQVSRTGTAVSASVPATGGLAPLTWSASTLPDGLTLNTSTGVVTGTPTTVETQTVTVDVTDSNNPAKTKSVTFDWRVLTPVQPTNPGPQSAAIGSSVNLAMTATGGATPYTWSATDLPTGLSINAGTGVITGTASRGTRFLSTVSVTDSAGMTVPTTFVFSTPSALGLDLSITAPAPSAPNQTTTVNTTVSLSAGASNGLTLVANTWTATNLPPGLTISGSGLVNATITGKPTTKGTYTVTLTVKDSGNRYAHEMFTWTVQ